MLLIHGHNVLQMMDGNSYNERSLLEAIEQKFGHDARFHTCTKTNMSAKQLIDFLKVKGKFKPTDTTKFTVDSKKICRH